MTNADKIMEWIDGSKSHCRWRASFEHHRCTSLFPYDSRAEHALDLVKSAYHKMAHDGLCATQDFTPTDLLQAAIAVTLWEAKP